VFKDESGTSDGERTNAFRYLTQNLSQAFDIYLENRNTHYPNLHAFCGPTRKLGGDNPDCIYLQSWINDQDTYKISGNRGTARMFNIAVQGPWTGPLNDPFGDRPFANVFGDELEVDWNGNFELWISPEPHEGNWIQSQPGTRKIFYRQYFDNWNEVPANYRIERIGDSDEPPPAIEPSELLDSFERAGNFVVDCTKDWPDILWNYLGSYDAVNYFIGADMYSDADDPSTDDRRGRTFQHLNWNLPLDEALIIEFAPEPAVFWQMCLYTVFCASLEYRHRQVGLTAGMTPADSDGMTRVVVSHRDPGFANWLDLQEHTRGWMHFRLIRSQAMPEMRTRVVKFADLEDEIGAIATRITPDERREEMRRRRAANMRRFPI
jgi:hypothetical protein